MKCPKCNSKIRWISLPSGAVETFCDNPECDHYEQFIDSPRPFDGKVKDETDIETKERIFNGQITRKD